MGDKHQGSASVSASEVVIQTSASLQLSKDKVSYRYVNRRTELLGRGYLPFLRVFLDHLYDSRHG